MAVREISGVESTPFQTAVRFVLAEPAVSSAVVGIRTEGQLLVALHAFDVPYSGTEKINKLKQILPVNNYTEHR
jgi:aryl-alcohol dehydrogenase-like predicted oxidoreductase